MTVQVLCFLKFERTFVMIGTSMRDIPRVSKARSLILFSEIIIIASSTVVKNLFGEFYISALIRNANFQ